jgi:NADH-quinone oxidoreductase subunit A
MNSIAIVAYLALFAAAGLLFVFVNLLIGRFLRPNDPHAEKREVYECGEPTIGSSYVQFDLRFYVVALLFLIFDVEVAFFFPWATVFGKATHLKDPALHAAVARADAAVKRAEAPGDRERAVAELAAAESAITSIYDEMGVPRSAQPTNLKESAAIAQTGKQLAWFSFVDILVFFGVILVGFAYVWMRGDLDWVRAVSRQRAATTALSAGQHLPPQKQTATV